MDSYLEVQNARWADGFFLCVGLDPQWSKIPSGLRTDGLEVEAVLTDFVCDVIDATAQFAGVFKLNFSFYIAHGWRGIKALEGIVAYMRSKHPTIPIILDHKGGDIGDTNAQWVQFAFELLGVHAVTLHNYMGWVAMEPYLARGDKGCYILCRTSNPGAEEFQKRIVELNLDEIDVWAPPERVLSAPLFEVVGRDVRDKWNANGNCGVVAGSSPTSVEELAFVRATVGEIPVLSPGVGKQGGSAAQAFLKGRNSEGSGIAINVSSGIIHASSESDYASAACVAAQEFHLEIQAARAA
jgi:orotidine-5'-phosphate decarboxylase